MRSPAKIIVALSATLALASPAVASGKDAKIKSQANTARAACLMGDYQKGTKILVDLFIKTGNPVHLFNQGRCYEQNHRWEEALDRFHEYLRNAPALDADTKAYVDKHVAECESHLPKAEPTPAPVPPPTTSASPLVPDLPSTPRSAPVSVPVPVVTTSAPQAESGSGLRTAGLITAGIGFAALAVAVVLNVKHESLAKEQNRPGNYSQSREDTVKAYQTWAWVGYGVGAAAVLAGGTMYILGRSSGHDGRQAVSLLPVFETQGAGCVLQGAF